MKQDEHREQAALMQWWAMESRYYGINERLPYAPERCADEARAGVLDLFLAEPLGVTMGCMER